jgi:hypothetical protein
LAAGFSAAFGGLAGAISGSYGLLRWWSVMFISSD